MSENSGNLAGFDATTVDPNVSFDPIPKNDYLAMITESGFKDVKGSNGASKYMQFTLEVLEGNFKKRLVFDRLNLVNDSEATVKIAQSTLSSICHALGIMKPKDTSEFHNKPMIITVDVEERNDKPGSFSNKVKKYTAVGGSSDKPKTESQGDGEKPPWKR